MRVNNSLSRIYKHCSYKKYAYKKQKYHYSIQQSVVNLLCQLNLPTFDISLLRIYKHCSYKRNAYKKTLFSLMA